MTRLSDNFQTSTPALERLDYEIASRLPLYLACSRRTEKRQPPLGRHVGAYELKSKLFNGVYVGEYLGEYYRAY